MKPRLASIATAIGYIVIGGIFAHVAPRFGVIFGEMEIRVPLVTRVVLALAPTGWILFGIVVAVFLVAKDLQTASRKIANWPFVVVLVVVVLIGIIALFLPVVMLEAFMAK